MANKLRLSFVFLALLVAIALLTSVSIVNEGEIAVKTRLGKIVQSIHEPGIYFKVPFMEQIEKMSSRSIEYDSKPAAFVTSDKKNIIIDTYARFRISDPSMFRTAAQGSMSRAQALLDDAIYSILRNDAGRHAFSEIIGINRATIMSSVTEIANKETKEKYGIEVLSVRIKRVSLPTENELFVYDRMRTERERQAKQYRSEGQEMALGITSETDREREVIMAEAYKTAQEILGNGEQEALKIYAAAYAKDPEFYAFLRTLEAYETTFNDQTVIVLDHDHPLLKYFGGK